MVPPEGGTASVSIKPIRIFYVWKKSSKTPGRSDAQEPREVKA
jgi:hypothetical protein